MHTITVSIQGDISVAENVDVNDTEALPLFIRLKAILRSEEGAQPAKRRGRPRKERPAVVEGDQHSAVSELGDAALPIEN